MLWPCNLPMFLFWQTVGDQWRMGPCGPVALDLVPVLHELDRMGLEKADYDQWLHFLKAMAAAALDEIRVE